MVPSGYGKQTALLIRQFQSLGHEVAVSAFHGVTGAIVDWHGTPIYPAGQAAFGIDVMTGHAQHFGADLLLTLMDVWKLAPVVEQLEQWRKTHGELACWIPVDCTPMGTTDRQVLARTGAVPIAMSRFGAVQLERAGFTPYYVPHSVDTEVFRPNLPGRAQLRAELGAEHDFVVGICAANRDAMRKAWPEQLHAFSLYHRHHPRSQLWIHTVPNGPNGLPLRELAQDMGIGHATRFTDEYPQLGGHFDDEDLALWYNAIDQLSNCSYAEGFGLPIIEAQACGTPAAATDASAMTELAHWLVSGDPFWNPVHRAWWCRPYVEEISKAYGYRVDDNGRTAESLAAKAARYGVDKVTEAHWRPVLEALGAAQ